MFTNKKSSEAGSGPSSANQQTSAVAPSRPAAVPPAAKSKPGTPSVLSSDLFIKGNLKTVSDIKIEGQVEGDVRARLLTIGEDATIRGQLVGDEIVVNGRIIGKIRGVKVRLNSGARVEGDIIHETIAVEAGAHFEGSVKRQENPLAEEVPGTAPRQRPTGPAPQQGQAKKPAPDG